MGRNLVVCLDGTNNEYAATNTNVVKLYEMLDRTRPDQIAYYQPGIGTIAPPGVWDKATRWLITRLDLAVAWLLEEHVTDAYRFLMRYYQKDDDIYLFGFSRGAYTARVLAGMLYKVGLLSAGNEELIPFAWDMYSRQHDEVIATGFRRTFSREVGVTFLGLWDTVSSVGWLWDPRHFQFTRENPCVKIVRHAVALDERRAYFRPNLWASEHLPVGQDVKQVWFPGVHWDIGGGYVEREAGLSKIALQWITAEAEVSGLLVDPAAKARIIPARDSGQEAAPNPLAVMHESLRGLWWIVEFIPKRIADPNRNFEPRYIIPRGRPRFVPKDATISDAVFERMKGDPSYRPRNLPAP